MRVLVRPCYPFFLENKLFRYEHGYSDRWMEPYVRWCERGAARGIELATWDMHPIESADVVICHDLPESRRELLQAKEKAPRAKFILLLVESPLGRPHAFDPRNHELFDAIVTYNWQLCDERRYFRYDLPIGSAPPPADPPYAERKPLVMINSNRLLGPLGMFGFRQSGWGGLPGIGWMFRDWKITPKAFFRQSKGEQYSRRRRLARRADAEFPALLDVFGPGWSGEPTGWIQKLWRPKPFRCARGAHAAKKDLLLPQYRFTIAFENVVADLGYISEKIFDALLAGVVPLYLGDARIATRVDPQCYVDARRFRTDRELLTFVRDCPESEWQALRAAGQRYLQTDSAKQFQSEAFATRMIEIIERVAPS